MLNFVIYVLQRYVALRWTTEFDVHNDNNDKSYWLPTGKCLLTHAYIVFVLNVVILYVNGVLLAYTE